jgi:hypothetical protein
MYPQFLIFSAFSPFMFEGVKTTSSKGNFHIRIWKLGSVLNGIFIGILPHTLLIVSDIKRGILKWNFHESNHSRFIFQNNDTLFKHQYGNITFATAMIVVSSILLLVFFTTKRLFRNKGVYCKVLNIMCCPFLNPCLNTQPEFPSNVEVFKHSSSRVDVPNVSPSLVINQDNTSANASIPSTTVVYIYKKVYKKVYQGEDKKWIIGNPDISIEVIGLEVSNIYKDKLRTNVIFYFDNSYLKTT